MIWDAAADLPCDHQWTITRRVIKSSKNRGFNERWGGSPGLRKQEASQQLTIESGFCDRCGAWQGSLGQEPSFLLYVKHICDIFEEVKRVLKAEGSCWIVLGDTYAGSGGAGGNWTQGKRAESPKWRQAQQDYPNQSLCLVPQRVAIELVEREWILRNALIWKKPNVFPSPHKTRFTIDYEQVLFLVKQTKYYFKQQLEPALTVPPSYRYNGQAQKDYGAAKAQNPSEAKRRILAGQEKQLQQGGQLLRNKRCVWTIPAKSNKEAHFAIYPERLIKPMVDAGCPPGGIVLDPFFGIGTTGTVALKLARSFIGIELNPKFVRMAEQHLQTLLEYHIMGAGE